MARILRRAKMSDPDFQAPNVLQAGFDKKNDGVQSLDESTGRELQDGKMKKR